MSQESYFVELFSVVFVFVVRIAKILVKVDGKAIKSPNKHILAGSLNSSDFSFLNPFHATGYFLDPLKSLVKRTGFTIFANFV